MFSKMLSALLALVGAPVDLSMATELVLLSSELLFRCTIKTAITTAPVTKTIENDPMKHIMLVFCKLSIKCGFRASAASMMRGGGGDAALLLLSVSLWPAFAFGCSSSSSGNPVLASLPLSSSSESGISVASAGCMCPLMWSSVPAVPARLVVSPILSVEKFTEGASVGCANKLVGELRTDETGRLGQKISGRLRLPCRGALAPWAPAVAVAAVAAAPALE